MLPEFSPDNKPRWNKKGKEPGRLGHGDFGRTFSAADFIMITGARDLISTSSVPTSSSPLSFAHHAHTISNHFRGSASRSD
jgi:hypothetical protein